MRYSSANKADVQGKGIVGYVLLLSLKKIAAACGRYFQSLYEDFRREMSGTKEKHRKSQRRLNRKKQTSYKVL